MSMIGREELSEEQQLIVIRSYLDFLEQVSVDPAAAGEDQRLARESLEQARQYSRIHTAEAVQTSANLGKDAQDPAMRTDATASLSQAAEAIRKRAEDISRRIAQRAGKQN